MSFGTCLAFVLAPFLNIVGGKLWVVGGWVEEGGGGGGGAERLSSSAESEHRFR